MLVMAAPKSTTLERRHGTKWGLPFHCSPQPHPASQLSDGKCYPSRSTVSRTTEENHFSGKHCLFLNHCRTIPLLHLEVSENPAAAPKEQTDIGGSTCRLVRANPRESQTRAFKNPIAAGSLIHTQKHTTTILCILHCYCGC